MSTFFLLPLIFSWIFISFDANKTRADEMEDEHEEERKMKLLSEMKSSKKNWENVSLKNFLLSSFFLSCVYILFFSSGSRSSI